VAKGGKPLRDLQPYLGAYGHLVALRSGDPAYLHVHPNGEPGDGKTQPGPEVSFTATAPSAGTYRLFLDFQHKGEVRTAAFTVKAGGAVDESMRSPRRPSPPRKRPDTATEARGPHRAPVRAAPEWGGPVMVEVGGRGVTVAVVLTVHIRADTASGAARIPATANKPFT
jgi:hypothetical protein